MRRDGGRPRRRTSAVADPNLIPLLDVVLQLIAFFMMLVHIGTRIEGETALIQLPEAPAALPTSDAGLDRLAVAIDRDGRLLVERGSPDRVSWWREQASKRREGLALLAGPGATAADMAEVPTLVVVRADRAARFGAVHTILEEARQAGFARFSLVVLREGSTP
jgi:biopolymer transport protein ExbD